MKSFLISQFNLTDIESFDLDKCSDTMAFLRYILKRTESAKEKSEIQGFMTRIEARCNQLKISKAA
jgi:hypothetical protein